MKPAELNGVRLQSLFQEVDLPEIKGINFSQMTHLEIIQLLPSYGGKHPMKGILIASGAEAEIVTHNSMSFKSGALSPERAAQAGPNWQALGHHMEAVGAAFMRKKNITDAVLYINGRNPGWGNAQQPGCYYTLLEFLAEGSTLSVYNKFGSDFIGSYPDRKFHFTGIAD